MLSAKSVIPECNIDSCLFDVFLNLEKQRVNHTKGNGTVIKKMKDKFENLFCVGIVDKDRRDLGIIEKEFEKIDIDNVSEFFLFFRSKQKKHHFLIQMVPAIEEWIFKVANELKIKISDFGIQAATTRELCQITKNVDKKDDPRFKALFKEFVKGSEKDNFLPVLKLKNLITLILKENYAADINDLKNV